MRTGKKRQIDILQCKGAEYDAHCDGNHQVKYLLLETVHLLEYFVLILPRYSHGNIVEYMLLILFFFSFFQLYRKKYIL